MHGSVARSWRFVAEPTATTGTAEAVRQGPGREAGRTQSWYCHGPWRLQALEVDVRCACVAAFDKEAKAALDADKKTAAGHKSTFKQQVTDLDKSIQMMINGQVGCPPTTSCTGHCS